MELQILKTNLVTIFMVKMWVNPFYSKYLGVERYKQAFI